MSVFSIASDTILQCFLMDLEVAKYKDDGGANHQPQSLQGFVDEVERRHGGERRRGDYEEPSDQFERDD